MPGNAEDTPGSDLTLSSDADVRLSPTATERARLCIKAAELRAQHKSFPQIARELHLATPAVAKRAVQQGLTLIPADDVREVRRLADQELHRIGRGLLEVITTPGPLVSQGKIMMNEEDPDAAAVPYPDQMVRVRAYEALQKNNAEWRKLHGADAPKRSVTMTSDMIAGRLAELRTELGEDAYRAALEWLNGPGDGR